MGATRRVTLKEAAQILGVSKEAVRKRVIRKTLRSDTGADGRRYVYLDAGGDEPPIHERDALISSKEETIAILREQLDAERQAHAEARRLLAAALERIPAIEAPTPQEPVGDAETVEEEPEGTSPRSDTEDDQEDTEPRQDRTHRLQQELLVARELLEDELSKSWWRRMFWR